MKKFICIFCSAAFLLSTPVYAASRKPISKPVTYKNYYVISNGKLELDLQKYLNSSSNKVQDTNSNQQTGSNNQTSNSTQKPSGSIQKPADSTQKPSDSTQKPSGSTALPEQTSNMAQQVLVLVNQERAKQNLAPLTLSADLSKVAQLKSEDMKNKNYFDHISPTYGSPFDMMKKYGINYKNAGENIAKGQKTAQAVVTAWMNSEGHRKNILNASFTEMGIGYVKSGSTTYWTQMFVRR